jgi:hypothetical protein
MLEAGGMEEGEGEEKGVEGKEGGIREEGEWGKEEEGMERAGQSGRRVERNCSRRCGRSR